MRKLLLIPLLVLSNLLYSEIWTCSNENAGLNPSEAMGTYTRVEGGFSLRKPGPLGCCISLKIIEENDKEIILYSHDEGVTYLDILDRKNLNFIVYGSMGINPKDDLDPAFGKCKIDE